MIKRKGVTKGDMVRAIKELHFELQQLARHLMMIDNVVDKYIRMNKDEKKLQKYMEKLLKEKKNERKQPKRKSSGRSNKSSK